MTTKLSVPERAPDKSESATVSVPVVKVTGPPTAGAKLTGPPASSEPPRLTTVPVKLVLPAVVPPAARKLPASVQPYSPTVPSEEITELASGPGR